MVTHNNREGNAEEAAENGRIELPEANRPRRRPRPPPVVPAGSENRTHFRPFKSEKEFKMIAETTTMLENSGFYWGTMTAKQAEVTLHGQPVGTFLIRDSSQKDVFFTLSYVSGTGSLNIRITFKASRFSLCGSKEEFDSLFKLLEYYTDSPKKLLTKPLRRVRLQSLQELCRKRIIETYGGDEIDSIPLNPVLKDFLNSFPYRL
ncbi:suppressor of cytokine signaling 1-like [Scleropages formosus]|uniref:Suppressor of cytokine signaling 1-like n=1 Tax=Scleropages formosus TaxID=113540 RepID=A0A0P7UKQ2_SCLFO|nr:suppressor of cytokine signaling 1 [Scleropages formosus]KPP74968.1 suppressor of cytokine signaling 1-like [Scleropages formosus]